MNETEELETRKYDLKYERVKNMGFGKEESQCVWLIENKRARIISDY